MMQKWAKTLAGYSVVVDPGQTVAINGGTAAEPLLRAIYREVIERGGYPVMLPTFSGLNADLLQHGNDEQLRFITPIEHFIREEADVVITVLAETNKRALSGVDPSRQFVLQKARGDLFKTFLERESDGSIQWTLTLFPTDAYAQDAEMSTANFADFVAKACKLDAENPVAAWQQQAVEQEHFVNWLTGKSEVQVVAPGTDLRLSFAGRSWINCDGRKNMPDGEVFSAPIETSVNGKVRFSYPAIYAGRQVSGIELEFEDGKVTRASATEGEEVLHRTLEIDEGARVLGEFAFGTNFGITQFVKEILFDEKIGGTIHMAVGSGYPSCGSQNVSAVHWDMLLDLRLGGTVTVDGAPFLVDGRYVV